METLSHSEVTSVAGAGPILGAIGGALIGVDRLANQFLNTSLISLPGRLLNLIPLVGKPAHALPDTLGYLVFKGIADLGHALGGQGEIDYHYRRPNEPGSQGFYR